MMLNTFYPFFFFGKSLDTFIKISSRTKLVSCGTSNQDENTSTRTKKKLYASLTGVEARASEILSKKIVS